MAQFTFSKTKFGTVEVFKDGNRIATTTPEFAKQKYGFAGEIKLPSLPQTVPTPDVPSVPTEPTLPTTTPPTPALTLPDTAKPNTNLVEFRNTLNQALQLATEKRNRLALEFGAPLRGTLSASSFGSILESLNVASQQFQVQQFGQLLPKAPKAGDLQFVSGTKTQSSGVFNRLTGIFTPLAGLGITGSETIEDVVETMSVLPTAGNIKTYLAATFNNPDISGGARTQIGNVVNVASALEDFASANPEGEFAGLGAGAGAKRFFSGLGTIGITELARVLSSEETKAERVENRQAIEAINLKMQIWASGAALTDTQTEQVKRLAPDSSDTDRQLKRKINGLYNFMMGQAEARLLAEGINNPIPKIDLFEFEELIGQASEEQLAELEVFLNQQQ